MKCGISSLQEHYFQKSNVLPLIRIVTVSPRFSSAVGSYKLGTPKASEEVTFYLKYSATTHQINPINQNEKAKKALAPHLITPHKILSPACLD